MGESAVWWGECCARSVLLACPQLLVLLASLPGVWEPTLERFSSPVLLIVKLVLCWVTHNLLALLGCAQLAHP